MAPSSWHPQLSSSSPYPPPNTRLALWPPRAWTGKGKCGCRVLSAALLLGLSAGHPVDGVWGALFDGCCILQLSEIRLQGQTVREQPQRAGQGREQAPGLVPITFPGRGSWGSVQHPAPRGSPGLGMWHCHRMQMPSWGAGAAAAPTLHGACSPWRAEGRAEGPWAAPGMVSPWRNEHHQGQTVMGTCHMPCCSFFSFSTPCAPFAHAGGSCVLHMGTFWGPWDMACTSTGEGTWGPVPAPLRHHGPRAPGSSSLYEIICYFSCKTVSGPFPGGEGKSQTAPLLLMTEPVSQHGQDWHGSSTHLPCAPSDTPVPSLPSLCHSSFPVPSPLLWRSIRAELMINYQGCHLSEELLLGATLPQCCSATGCRDTACPTTVFIMGCRGSSVSGVTVELQCVQYSTSAQAIPQPWLSPGHSQAQQ